MPDITMCKNYDCPQADNCWRLGCSPSQFQQAYQVFEPTIDTDEEFKCDYFLNYPNYDEPKL